MIFLYIYIQVIHYLHKDCLLFVIMDVYINEFKTYDFSYQHNIINELKCFLFQNNNKTNKRYMDRILMCVNNKSSEDELKILFAKLCNIYNKKVKKYVNVLTSSKTSKLAKYLLNMSNVSVMCKCGNVKIFLDKCVNCFNFECDYNNLKCNVNKLFVFDDVNKFKKEFIVLKEYCMIYSSNISKITCDYKKSCNANEITSVNNIKNVYGLNFINVVKYVEILYDDELNFNRTGEKLMLENCYDLLLMPKHNVKYKYNDVSHNINTYLENYCKLKQLENMTHVARKMCDYVKYVLYNNDKPKPHTFLDCKHTNVSIEFKFCFDLMKNDKYLQYVKQIIIHPYVFGRLMADCFLLLFVNDHVIKLHVEFDDYTNYDKLTGGHSIKQRKLHDVVKDVYCLLTGCSLIRLKCTENIFDLFDDMIEKKQYPYYRFYDGYLKNKIIL